MTKNAVYRRSKECPKVLRKYIDLVNDLPQNAVLLSVQMILEKWLAEYQPSDSLGEEYKGWSKRDIWDMENSFWSLQALYVINKHYKPFPIAIKKYLFEGEPKKYRTEGAAAKDYPHYFEPFLNEDTGAWSTGGDLLDLTVILTERFFSDTLEPRIQTLARLSELFRALGARHEEGSEKQGWHPGGGGVIGSFNLPITINKSGFLEVGGSDIYEAIGRGEIDGSRIRSCPICSKIYWASRSNKKACDETCASTLRQRNYRNRDRGKEAEAKRKNRDYKKQRKHISQKRMGGA